MREVLIVVMTSSGGSASYVFPLIILAAIALAGFWLWTLVDVLSWPQATWGVAGQSKARWVMRVLLLGVLGSVLYLRSARGQLRAAYSTVRTAGRR